MKIFDRNKKAKQFEKSVKYFDESDFLHKESAQRIADQFEFIITKKFENALVLGSRSGELANLLKQNNIAKNIFQTNLYVHNSNSNYIIADEEFLPFAANSFDLVVSNLSLQWVNDLPGCLVQIKNILQKGGYFCANMAGGRSLVELRNSFLHANEGGQVSPRISPFIDVKDAAALLQRAGFAEPVALTDDIIVKYSDLTDLMKDLKNTGETNALEKMSNKFVGKNYFAEVEKYYKNHFSDEENNLNATFELVTLSGWKG